MPTFPNIELENSIVLDLVQALWGVISDNMRSVSVVFAHDRVVLHFILKRESAEDREEIADVPDELSALRGDNLDIEALVFVSSEPWPSGVSTLPGRPVFVRRFN